MKFTLSLLALPFLGAIAAPTAEVNTLAARQDNSSAEAQAYATVEALYTQIQEYTGAINATAASLGPDSTAADNATAAADFRTNVNAITAAVNAATPEISGLSARDVLSKRQTDTQLANLVSNLLLEISGALGGILDTLGLGSLLGALTPLTVALSGLLVSLQGVVDQLLALVKQLVDGLLTGLSIGLLGL